MRFASFLSLLLACASCIACSTSPAAPSVATDLAADTATISLTPLPPDDLAAAREDFLATCRTTGTWCSMSAIDAFAVEDAKASIDAVAAAVRERYAYDDQPLETVWEEETTMSREELASSPYFHFHGPRLLAQIDAWAGSTDVVTSARVAEIPCPNCHDFAMRYVLFYADVGRVVVIHGKMGYDS